MFIAKTAYSNSKYFLDTFYISNFKRKKFCLINMLIISVKNSRVTVSIEKIPDRETQHFFDS